MFRETVQNNVRLFTDGRCERACGPSSKVPMETGRYFDSQNFNTAEMKPENTLL